MTRSGQSISWNPMPAAIKSPASIAKSNKQWVGICLYQEESPTFESNKSRGEIFFVGFSFCCKIQLVT